MNIYNTQLAKALSESQDLFNKQKAFMKWNSMFIDYGVGTGLQNLGNSCFMNATLQCLAYSLPFGQLLCQANHSSRCQSTNFCLLCEMEIIISSMLTGNTTVIPINLFHNLSKINDLLIAGRQEDAHEFILSLLDKLEILYDKCNKNSMNHIRKLFTGSTKTFIQCIKCGHVSITEEPYYCLSLEVDKQTHLKHALNSFTEHELMTGDEKYFCNKCKQKQDAVKQLTLSDVPEVLMLHFKRFKMENGSSTKISHHVGFPETLDFKTLKRLIFDNNKKNVLNQPNYELYGVLVHKGKNAEFGHYYSFIKAPNDYWYKMNDSEVSRVDIDIVLDQNAYILFYRKIWNKHVNGYNTNMTNYEAKSEVYDDGWGFNYNIMPDAYLSGLY